MSEIKDKVDFYELINANQVTDAGWDEVKAYAEAGLQKDWDDYLERKNHFDDAFYTQSSYYWNLKVLAENNGYVFEHVLAKGGEVVPCEIVNTKYGKSWIVKSSWDKDAVVVEWVNVSVASTNAKQQAHYAKKGYSFVVAEVRGRFVNGKVQPVWSDVKSVEVI